MRKLLTLTIFLTVSNLYGYECKPILGKESIVVCKEEVLYRLLEVNGKLPEVSDKEAMILSTIGDFIIDTQSSTKVLTVTLKVALPCRKNGCRPRSVSLYTDKLTIDLDTKKAQCHISLNGVSALCTLSLDITQEYILERLAESNKVYVRVNNGLTEMNPLKKLVRENLYEWSPKVNEALGRVNNQ